MKNVLLELLDYQSGGHNILHGEITQSFIDNDLRL